MSMNPHAPVDVVPAGSENPPSSRYEVDPFNGDRMRGHLMYMLFSLVLATIIFAMVQDIRGYWESARELVEIVLTTEFALLGSAVGFYFRSERDF
jgi:hypothetical protein